RQLGPRHHLQRAPGALRFGRPRLRFARPAQALCYAPRLMSLSRLLPRLAGLAAALLLALALRPESLSAQGLSWGPTGAEGAQWVDSGRFEITSAGRKVGVEHFQIKSSGD